jgi:hypothetical protein
MKAGQRPGAAISNNVESKEQVKEDATRAPIQRVVGRRTCATALMRFTMSYPPKVTT